MSHPLYLGCKKVLEEYCNHPGVGVHVGVHVGVAQMLKFLVEVFISPYLMNKLILCMLVDIGLKFYAVPL